MSSASPTTKISHPLVNGCPPDWATAWGQDEFGIFAEFSIANTDSEGEVSQRMRWIPPGKFVMGDQADGPPRDVTLTQPFWIFDTPCRQDLYALVMGDNPSRFVDPERPVEQVSWEDAQEFMGKLNTLAGLNLVLPTEAQWEYACRAGTTKRTYIGDIEIVSDYNSPELGRIAWYGGNSGHDFDLDKGFSRNDYSFISEPQHDFERIGSRKVAKKVPNRWGLHDMLGNVWEWCWDWYGDYLAERNLDPVGPSEGRYRVVRGGSWADLAQELAFGLPVAAPRPTTGSATLVSGVPKFNREVASVMSEGLA